MKKELKRLNDLIRSFEQIVDNYPTNDAYKDILAKLINDRINLVNTIGNKK